MNPDPLTPEKPTLAALGLEKKLPSTAPPDQRGAAREVQDTAALTWLAVADLQPAPDSIWQGIQARIAPAPASLPAPRRHWQAVVSYGGWAAAAALALGWWLQDPQRPHSGVPKPPNVSPPTIAHQKVAPAAPRNSAPVPPPADSALREELEQLQQRLTQATLPQDNPGLHQPAIVELRPPGSATTPATAAEAAARLQQLVTKALQRDLLLRDARDGSAIVLERGWPQAGWLPTDSGQTIRHLSFPANRWEELGLWKAPDQFYDPATSLTWSPAPDGLGYLGRVTPAAPDPTGYQIPTPGMQRQSAPAEAEPKSAPAGYLVSEPGTQDATLLLTDLPPVPPGMEQVVIASNTAIGSEQQYVIPMGTFTWNSSGGSMRSLSVGSDSISLGSFPLTQNSIDFSVVQRNVGATSDAGGWIILSGGGTGVVPKGPVPAGTVR